MSSRLFKTDLQTKLKKDMQQKLDKERMQRDFPFHPQTNEWHFENREDVLSHLQQKETERQYKLAMLMQQRELEISANVPSSPTISPYSRSLTFDQPFHLRLYASPRGAGSHAMHGYDPEELEGERRRARKGNPDFEKLYEDAQTRRTNHEQAILKAQYEQDMQCGSKKLKGKSLNIMSQKCEKTIQQMADLVMQGTNGADTITQELLADVLRAIGIFKMYPGAENKSRAAQEEKSLKKLCAHLQALRRPRSSVGLSDDPSFFLPPPSPVLEDSPSISPFLPPPPPLSPPPPADLPLPPPPISPSPLLSPLPPTTPTLDESFRTATPFSVGIDLQEGAGEMRAHDAIDFLAYVIKRCVPTEENRRINEETLQLPSPEERLIRRFITLQQTARAYDTLYQRSPSPPREEHTFKPTLNSKSLSMESGRGGGKDTPARYNKLYMMSTAMAEKRAKMQEEGEKKKVKECTFTPQVNNHVEKPDGMKKSEALFNMSKSKKKNENAIPSHLARDLKHCTFQPNMNSTRRSLEYLQRPPPETPRGVEEFEKRLKQAQQSREELQAMLERPSYPKPSALHAKPPSFLAARAKPVEPPVLYVDIKLAHGRTGRVGIHRGDDPKILAQNFANAFHLEQKLTAKLEIMLKQHIDNLENMDQQQQQQQESYYDNNNDNNGNNGSYGSEGEYGNGENVYYKDNRGYHSDD